MIVRGLLPGNVAPFIWKALFFVRKRGAPLWMQMMACFCFTKYWQTVLGIIKYLYIYICTYKYALYICEQVRDLDIQYFQVCGDWWKKKGILKWETFHNWWFCTSETRTDLLIFGVFQVDRETRLCFYLCDTAFIYGPGPEHWGSCAFQCVQSVYTLQMKTKTLALFWEQRVLGSLF